MHGGLHDCNKWILFFTGTFCSVPLMATVSTQSHCTAIVFGITGYIGRYHRTTHNKEHDIHFLMLLSNYDSAHNICNELMILMVRKHAAERSRWHMKHLLTV